MNPGQHHRTPKVALFRLDDLYYVVSNEIKATCNITDFPPLAWLSKYKHELVPMIGEMESSTHTYLMYCSDCYTPPMYIVFADSEEEAIDVFIDETDICKIPADKPNVDYKNDDVVLNGNGEFHDISELIYEPVELVALWY